MDEIGKYGGTWTMLVAKSSDVKLNTVYGNANLIAWDRDLSTLVPDVAESFEMDEKGITYKLRKGLKWSDGMPLTTEDVRFVWEDVMNNEELAPNGPPGFMRYKNKEIPTLTIMNEYTFRIEWSKLWWDYVKREAGPSDAPFLLPSHYLKQFHAKYADAAQIEQTGSDCSD